MEDIESLEVQESRPLQATRKIMVRGAVDIVFRRSATPRCVVAGDTADTVAAVKTYYQGSTLMSMAAGQGASRAWDTISSAPSARSSQAPS